MEGAGVVGVEAVGEGVVGAEEVAGSRRCRYWAGCKEQASLRC